MKALTILFAVASLVYHIPTIIQSIELVDGKIEVVKSQSQAWTTSTLVYKLNGDYDFSNAIPRKVWKEIYIAKDGKIVLEKTIEGKVIPAQDERIEFPE